MEKFEKTMAQITKYSDINQLLQFIVKRISGILGDNFVGVYLFGSLTYGDFNPESSDIDLVTILKNTITHDQLTRVKELHKEIERRFPKWSKRLELSYTPVDLFKNVQPPIEPRPYYGEGTFYDEASYGNEWIINNQLLRTHGISLIGPTFSELIPPIDPKEVQMACIKDLFKEWEPKLNEPEWLNNSHYQSYLVMNLCRILYTVMTGNLGSKIVSARWVKDHYPQWRTLIEVAEKWHYEVEMTKQTEALEFLKFVINEVKDNNLYN